MEQTEVKKDAMKKDVIECLELLKANVVPDNKSTQDKKEQLDNLTQLKIHSRSPSGASRLFAENGLEILSNHAFQASTSGADLEALRCIANILLQVPQSRQQFVDLGFDKLIVSKLANVDNEHEFLFARLLFLTTYQTNCDFASLVDQNQLGDILCQNLQRHATTLKNRIAADPTASRPQAETMALAETLKLLFNVVYGDASLSDSFTPAIPCILTLLELEKIQQADPLEPLSGYLINALLNLRLSKASEALFPPGQPELHAVKLIDILRNTIKSYPQQDQDTRLPPILSLLAKISGIAPQKVQANLKTSLLPADQERTIPLGQAESLSGGLLRLSTTAKTAELRDVILSLLYGLSDNDPSTFVRNVGYGYASGFFVNHDIQTAGLFSSDGKLELNGDGSGRVTEIDDDDEEKAGEEKEGEMSGKSANVNFVTGQYLSSEPQQEEDTMSEEEKLREAERLFVLFERLKATGVVDVENPVEAAARAGRLD